MQGVKLVTGAVGGMGRACALEFARQGARLVLTDLDAAALARVCTELRATGTDAQPVAGDIAEPFAELRDAVNRQCAARRLLVTAEALEQFGGRFESFEKVKARYAARRAGCESGRGVAVQYERGTVKAIDHTARDNTDHTDMPALAVDDDDGHFLGRRRLAEIAHDLIDDAHLGLLPFGVEVVELEGDLGGAVRVGSGE